MNSNTPIHTLLLALLVSCLFFFILYHVCLVWWQVFAIKLPPKVSGISWIDEHVTVHERQIEAVWISKVLSIFMIFIKEHEMCMHALLFWLVSDLRVLFYSFCKKGRANILMVNISSNLVVWFSSIIEFKRIFFPLEIRSSGRKVLYEILQCSNFCLQVVWRTKAVYASACVFL